jgi:fumarate reductase subunit C
MSEIKTKKKNARSVAAGQKNQSVSRRSYEMIRESDSTYLLKLVIYVILGALWIRFSSPIAWHGFLFTALPLGVVVGLILVRNIEKLQEDRKIWYAVIIIVGIISNFASSGIIL